MRNLTTFLAVRDSGMYEVEGSHLTLESIQGPNELLDVCSEALRADEARERTSKRARLIAERAGKPSTLPQPQAMSIGVGELPRINYYLSAVGLEFTAGGILTRIPRWTSPNTWRWRTRNSIWDFVRSFPTGTWDAQFVYDWLRDDRKKAGGDKLTPLLFSVFIGELRRWEDAHPGMTIDQQIRALRRAAHEESLPFDQAIGVPKGGKYEYLTGGVGGELQFLKDHNAVRIGGRVFDIWHLFVDLEAIPLDRPNIDVEFGGTVRIVVPTRMESAAAATWAGDIGAAAADWWWGIDMTREPKTGDERKLRYYWNTRAPPKDLDADISAWGLLEERASLPWNLRRLSDLLLHFFAKGSMTATLREAFRSFVRYYGEPGTGKLAVSKVRTQIMEFARIWALKRLAEGRQTVYTFADLEWAVDQLTSWFVNYVEDRT